jgi:endonuclease/exonuclease/phosphatase family metal-dependent hydrolase
VDIPYGGAPFIDTEREAVRFARETRGPAVELIKQELGEADAADATFVFGDFNEPSAHDWTPRRWPRTSSRSRSRGRRRWRSRTRASSTPTARSIPTRWSGPPIPGHRRRSRQIPTTTTTGIDFVLARGEDLGVEDAAIVGEGGPQADVVVTPWPSDHRASSATVRF